MSGLLPCAKCGESVRLGEQRVTVNRRRGIIHCVGHNQATQCGAADGFCSLMLKPYPARLEDKEWFKLIQRWNAMQEEMAEMQIRDRGAPIK